MIVYVLHTRFQESSLKGESSIRLFGNFAQALAALREEAGHMQDDLIDEAIDLDIQPGEVACAEDDSTLWDIFPQEVE